MLSALAGQSDCTVAAVLDGQPHAAPAWPSGVTVAGDFDRLLATGIDFVVLLGPLQDRLPQVQAAAEQGVACLLGSPMAGNLADASAMVAAAEAAGVELGVLVPGQEDPVYDLLRRWLASDWLGSPLSMLIHGQLPGLRPTAGLLPLIQFARWWLQRDVRHAVALPNPANTAGAASAALLELGGRVQLGLVASTANTAPVLSLHGSGGSVQLDATGLQLCGRQPRHDALLSQPVGGKPHALAWNELAAARQVARTGLLPVARFARMLDHRDDFPCLGNDALADLQVLAALQRQVDPNTRGPV